MPNPILTALRQQLAATTDLLEQATDSRTRSRLQEAAAQSARSARKALGLPLAPLGPALAALSHLPPAPTAWNAEALAQATGDPVSEARSALATLLDARAIAPDGGGLGGYALPRHATPPRTSRACDLQAGDLVALSPPGSLVLVSAVGTAGVLTEIRCALSGAVWPLCALEAVRGWRVPRPATPAPADPKPEGALSLRPADFDKRRWSPVDAQHVRPGTVVRLPPNLGGWELPVHSTEAASHERTQLDLARLLEPVWVMAHTQLETRPARAEERKRLANEAAWREKLRENPDSWTVVHIESDAGRAPNWYLRTRQSKKEASSSST